MVLVDRVEYGQYVPQDLNQRHQHTAIEVRQSPISDDLHGPESYTSDVSDKKHNELLVYRLDFHVEVPN